MAQVSSPSLDDNGNVAFSADYAAFLRTKDTMRIVAAFGDPAPGGGIFTVAGQPAVKSGKVAFYASALQPSRSGTFISEGLSITQVVAIGTPAPDVGIFSYARELAMNDEGEVVCLGSTAPGGEGIFLYSHDTIRVLARAGTPAPGGGVSSYFGYPSLNNNADIVFHAGLSPSGIGVFSISGGVLTSVARSGDPSPAGGTFDFSAALTSAAESRNNEANGDATFSYIYFAPTSINDAGAIAFSARASIAGRGGIFVYHAGSITRAVRENDLAPGGGFLGLPDSPSLNGAGDIAFRANVYGGPVNGYGLFLLSQGRVTTVVRPEQRLQKEIHSQAFMRSRSIMSARSRSLVRRQMACQARISRP